MDTPTTEDWAAFWLWWLTLPETVTRLIGIIEHLSAKLDTLEQRIEILEMEVS